MGTPSLPRSESDGHTSWPVFLSSWIWEVKKKKKVLDTFAQAMQHSK